MDLHVLTADLLDAARAGDWERLEVLSAMLPDQAPLEAEHTLVQHVFQLRAALIAARTTRADLVKSLHRLSAASRFCDHFESS